MDFTAPVSGAVWPWPDTDVIEEMEVVSLGASAEHGNSPGAAFNVVTRQGTNLLRGDAAYFGMFDALTARPTRVGAAGRRNPDGWGFTRSRYRDATVHAGGPLRPDRVWIYGGYQHLQDWDSQPGAEPAHPRGCAEPRGTMSRRRYGEAAQPVQVLRRPQVGRGIPAWSFSVLVARVLQGSRRRRRAGRCE